MKFLNCLFIHSEGDSKLRNKRLFHFKQLNHNWLKSDNILRNIQTKKIFHSLENQHFKFINVGFFLILKTRHQ